MLASQIVALLPGLPTIQCYILQAIKNWLANQIANQTVVAIDFDFNCAYQTIGLFGHMMDDVA